jgi:Icc protein
LFRRISCLICLLAACAAAADPFRFVILGDRTGEAQPGVYERVWKLAATERPAFAIATGDSIEGGKDATAEAEWRGVRSVWEQYAKIPLYLTAGNHDIWPGSVLSEQLYRKYSGRAVHYSFDYGDVHITVLDNSRTEEISAEELRYLESDLKAHAGAAVKMVFSHRPSWIVKVALMNTDFPLHALAKRYGVRYVVAGHLHQLVRVELDGVTYLSMPSSGGHLRLSKAYEDGWFFGYARVGVDGAAVALEFKEISGRTTSERDWGPAGLIKR